MKIKGTYRIYSIQEEKMTQDQKRQTEINIFKCIYIKHCIKYKWSMHLKSRSCQTELTQGYVINKKPHFT